MRMLKWMLLTLLVVPWFPVSCGVEQDSESEISAISAAKKRKKRKKRRLRKKLRQERRAESKTRDTETQTNTDTSQDTDTGTNESTDIASDTGSDEPESEGCSIFPATNAWNVDISDLPVHPNSNAYIEKIGASKNLHPDFGSGTYMGQVMGIPTIKVAADQDLIPVDFNLYGDESDPGPYPIPLNAPIEAGIDRHVIAVDLHNCKLYELYKAEPKESSWLAGNGAVFDLKSSAVPPRVGNSESKIGWTSADAAGLPIYPGLARWEEVAKGEINHALRFTVERTQKAYISPATHYASSLIDPNLPPMGLRFRLKKDVDISRFSKHNQVILKALKTYGMIVADNGGDWMISGESSESWNNDDLNELKSLKGSDFEVVDTGDPITKGY